MSTTALAAVASFFVIFLCKHQKTFFRVMKILFFETFILLSFRHLHPKIVLLKT